ncbi:hypothetical protein Cus16_0719 [Curtobacterium sp. ER1/6]|nr:hypothetical protein Cus16_0719 [Curtobacterium sp. ER1/6]
MLSGRPSTTRGVSIRSSTTRAGVDGDQYRTRTHDDPMNEPGGCSGVPRGPPCDGRG